MCSAVWAAGYTPRSKLVLWCATRNNFELYIDRLNDLQCFSTQLTLALGQDRCAVGLQLSAAEDLGIAACSLIYTSSIFSSRHFQVPCSLAHGFKTTLDHDTSLEETLVPNFVITLAHTTLHTSTFGINSVA
jgi:hypothetical protein